MALHSLPLAFYWLENRWPWMTLNGRFTLNFVFGPVCLDSCLCFPRHLRKTNKYSGILSAAEPFSRNSSSWWCKIYAQIRGGSLESTRETTVGASVYRLAKPSAQRAANIDGYQVISAEKNPKWATKCQTFNDTIMMKSTLSMPNIRLYITYDSCNCTR